MNADRSDAAEDRKAMPTAKAETRMVKITDLPPIIRGGGIGGCYAVCYRLFPFI